MIKALPGAIRSLNRNLWYQGWFVSLCVAGGGGFTNHSLFDTVVDCIPKTEHPLVARYGEIKKAVAVTAAQRAVTGKKKAITRL